VVPQGTLYVASPGEVEAFPLNTNGPAAPQRSLTVPSQSIPLPGVGSVAVAPDGTLYATYFTSSAYVAAIGLDGQTKRTIGPLAGTVTALVVDRIGELYVAQSGGTKLDFVDVFASGANGAATPLRELVTPITANTPGGSWIASIAIAD
jgi:hypothetical protein